MKRLLLLAAILATTVFTAGALSASAGTPQTVGHSGIHGLVLIGPTGPTCQLYPPCTVPLPGALIEIMGNGYDNVYTADGNGQFTACLPWGNYFVRPLRSPGARLVAPSFWTTVRPVGFTNVRIVYDTGIR